MAHLIESAFDYRSLFGIMPNLAPAADLNDICTRTVSKERSNLCVSIDLRWIFPWPLFSNKFDLYLAFLLVVGNLFDAL